MTISSTTARMDYTGNGATSVYPYTFKISFATDLEVKQQTVAGIETTLTLNAGYTVSGVGVSGGGSVTLIAGSLPTNYKLSIRFKAALLQGTDIRNQGGYFPETTEDTFDRDVRYDQQQQDEIDRSIKFPSTDGTSINTQLPVASIRALQFLAFNAQGGVISSPGISSVPVSSFMATVLDDTDAATALNTLGAASVINMNLFLSQTYGAL